MDKKEQKLLKELYQLRDVWELQAWQSDNDAQGFSDEFVDEVNELRDSLEYTMRARRQENIDYYKQEDRISNDPEIR
jgi:hypothetical protein